MSAKNGDKARYQKNRKRAVMRRSKMREMAFYLKEAADTAAKGGDVKAEGQSHGASGTDR